MRLPYLPLLTCITNTFLSYSSVVYASLPILIIFYLWFQCLPEFKSFSVYFLILRKLKSLCVVLSTLFYFSLSTLKMSIVFSIWWICFDHTLEASFCNRSWGYGRVLTVITSSPEIVIHQRNRCSSNTAESRTDLLHIRHCSKP